MFNPLELLASMIPMVMGLTAVSWLTFYGWRMTKALIGAGDQVHSLSPDPERELRLAQMRARRLRTARYQDEHSSWDEEFRALGGGCSCHGGLPRTRVRESPPVARW